MSVEERESVVREEKINAFFLLFSLSSPTQCRPHLPRRLEIQAPEAPRSSCAASRRAPEELRSSKTSASRLNPEEGG